MGIYRYLPFVLLLVVLSLSFYVRPAAEDLSIHYYDQVYGLSGNIRSFYHNESSRYFSFPLLFVLLDGKFILTHYYLVALILLLSLWAIFFFSTRLLGRILFSIGLAWKTCAWVSAVLLLAICSVLFEPAGILYWISGSMTYLPSFILFGLLLLLLLRAAGRGRMNVPELVFAALLGVAAAGGNEITLFFLLLSLLWIQAGYYSVYGRLWRVVNVLGVIVLLCFIAFIVPGGTRHRAGNFKLNFSIGHGLLVGIGYACRITVRALSSPLVWFCMVLAGYAGSMTALPIRNKLAGSRVFRPWLFLAAVPCVVAFFYFLIYLFSGEILPGRAKDLLLFYLFFLLLAAAFLYGVRSGFGLRLAPDIHKQPVVKLLVLAVFVVTPLSGAIVENIFSGYLYVKVMEKREAAIAASRESGRHTVVLAPYAEDRDAVLRELRAPKPVKEFFARGDGYPSLILYKDPLADTALYIHFYADYQGIDSIGYLGRSYGRTGLEKSERIK